MQIFAPYPDFVASARVLDTQRLLSQINESLVVWKAAQGLTRNWHNHPIVKMWQGYEEYLRLFRFTCITEAFDRGIVYRWQAIPAPDNSTYEVPEWWRGCVHSQYRANLLYKYPEHYEQFGWSEQPDKKRLYIVAKAPVWRL